MSKEFEEEFFSPCCEVHFACNRFVVGMSSHDVECDASQEGEVLGSVILARSGVVFVEAWPG